MTPPFSLASWAQMWLLASAIFAFCKWLSFREARSQGVRAPAWHNFAYLCLWPGMDAQGFLQESASKPSSREWRTAFLKTIFGLVLLFALVRQVPADQALLRGWLGMLGIIFILHFGSFHLIALFWQARGVNAKKLFHAPLRATSLRDFWGRRWNDAFRELTHRFVYRPLRPRFGASGALMTSFFASGLIHEAVISVPARGGWGLPTAYFVFQGLGILLESSRWGAKNPGSGRAFALVWTAAPAFFLFHPPFVERVILPFLSAIGAT